MTTTRIAGIDLHVEHGGSGPGLLCLHGIGSGAVSFLAQVAGLGDLREVVAWDAPGYGRSSDAPVALDMAGYAEVAAELVREWWGGPAAVMGASWGGTIATVLAVRYPELVERLVLVDSTRGSARTPERADAMRRRGAELAELGPRAFAHERAPRLVSPTGPAAMVELARTTMAASIRLPGYAQAAVSMAETWLATDDLARVAAPTLIICGSDDQVTGLPESTALAEAIPDAELHVVPGAGHLANVEAPDVVNTLVRNWLTSAADTGRS